MGILDNKIAFITGGSRGIGAGIVQRFAAEGATIGFSYRTNADSAHMVKAMAEKYGQQCFAYPCDGTQPEAIEQTMTDFIEKCGGIDILVNNAGIIRDNLVTNLPLEDWQIVLDSNLTAAYLHTQWALKSMIRVRKGIIINISSIAGIHGNIGQANYAASKAGLIGLTKSIAREVGSRNIRCNAIAPGIIETDMTGQILLGIEDKLMKNIPLKRFGKVEDIANLSLFLASEQSAYITGQVINVCGGLST